MLTTDIPADSAARTAILGDMDVNMVVEAAAGTGKTTCLVGRIMTLFRRGALMGEGRLAAITFTNKAAAELRERLSHELDGVLKRRDESPPDELSHLEAARAVLPECHIGTIHSFCARLLRERPVEAGIGPDFSELSEADDETLRRQAWEEFVRQLHQNKHGEIQRVFETFGLNPEILFQGFENFTLYPDIDDWIGSDAKDRDIDAGLFIREVDAYDAGLDTLRPFLDQAEPGNDDLIPILQILDRRLPRLTRPIRITEAFQLSELFKENPKIVHQQWRQLGKDSEESKEMLADYQRFYRQAVAPFRRACLAAVYSEVIRSFGLARGFYDNLRRAGRLLNFQDILLAAARLLREYPRVRADMADRYRLLLIDEVQDTDPVQAEIMFLLASSDSSEKDWRRCRPRPGALFIVGDPKQSIYRFRRADITVYQEIKRLIAQNGGRMLDLSVNFRSRPAVIKWVNLVFGPKSDTPARTPEEKTALERFSAEESPYSPAYIPLKAGLALGETACLTGVFKLETLDYSPAKGVNRAVILQDEANRIARFIRYAVDSGIMLPGRSGPRPARPDDFLIITYKKEPVAIYASALRRLGLPCQASGGRALSDSRALDLLQGYLEALAWPDDAIRLLAVLRGGLFGISDPDLYRWKKLGGEFSFLARRPETADSPLPEAMRIMARHHAGFRRREPIAALADMAEELGLWSLASLGDDPAAGAGVMNTVFELLQADAGGIATPGELAVRLAWLRQNHREDPIPATEQPDAAVRVMNLHKVKGLEAPVVFLTCTRMIQEHSPGFALQRSEGRVTGALSIVPANLRNAIARPAAWEKMEAEERLFLAAEKTRLKYVAATRAGSALVISVHKANKKWQSRFLPDDFNGAEVGEALPEPDPKAVHDDAGNVLETLDTASLFLTEKERERRRPVLLAESYRTVRAKAETVLTNKGIFHAADAAREFGEALHCLLAMPTDGKNQARVIRELLREYDLPAELAEEAAVMLEAVRNSDIWKRSEKAEKRFLEAPYVLAAGEDADRPLERGIIDLVFREKAWWVLVDYKSDHLAPGADRRKAAARHAGQLAAYTRAWREISGERVTEAGIFFLRTGEYVIIPDF